MNILLINHSWLEPELRELGHQVFSVGFNNPGCDYNSPRAELPFASLLEKLPQAFQPERIVYFDDSGVPWIPGLEECRIPKLFFSVDTFHHEGWHIYLAEIFDRVLVAQKNYVSVFRDRGRFAEWFPLWATKDLCPSPEKRFDASFVGTMDPTLNKNRVEFFQELSKRFPIQLLTGNIADVYPYSKIVVNQTFCGDLNFRLFEGMMAGAMMLTPDTPHGLHDLFLDGVDLVTYPENDFHVAAEKLDEFTQNSELRQTIALQGRTKVLNHHSARVRATQLVEHLAFLAHSPSPLYYFGSAVASLTSYLVSHHGGFGWGKAMLFSGAQALVKSTQRKEPLPPEFLGTVDLFVEQLRSHGENAAADQMLSIIRESTSTSS